MASNAVIPEASLAERRHPFDAAASGYDVAFTDTRLGRWYRNTVWEHLDGLFRSGDRVLELGCGTGEDAIWLARRGVRVTATDASARMLTTTREKVAESGLGHMISLRPLDLNIDFRSAEPVPKDLTEQDTFDGVLANFGPLNCVEDRPALARQLAAMVRPGGHLAMTVMGPICPWESVWHSARLEFGTAFRRLRSGKPARVGDGGTLPVWYPSLRRIESEFAPFFRTVERLGLGLLLPPSGMAPLVDRFPRAFRVLAVIDRHAAHLRPWLWFNDHYLLVMERRSG